MADAHIKTFQDLIEYAAQLRHGGSRTQEQTDLRTAIMGAYDDISNIADWQYFDTEYRLDLNASYSTGTVAYDLTGHASGERALTITTGTWPSWIANGRVRIGGVVYKVDRVSGSAATILLDSVLSPPADIASTSFIAYQTVYQLPADLVSIEDIMVEEGAWCTTYLEPGEWLQQERYTQTTGRTWAWTLMKDPKNMGRWAVFIDPIPDTAEPLGFIYRRRPRTLRYAGTESGSRILLSGSAAATTVTTTTTLSQSMVGSFIRIYDTTNYPTGLPGVFPFLEQHEIYSISSTTVTLRTALSAAAASSTKAVVTDPVDMSDTMYEALLCRLEYRMARMYGEGKNLANIAQLSDREIRIALERDSRVKVSRTGYLSFSDWMGRIDVTTES